MVRAWIVGNGPSLAETPLDKLLGEIAFATNRINLIYNKTPWRPTHYVRTESIEDVSTESWEDDLLVHLNNPNIEVWCNPWFIKKLRQLGHAQSWGEHTLATCAHYTKHFDNADAPVGWHLPYLCSFGSSLTTAIQLAVLKGYSPIYLVGCDLGYGGEQDNFSADYSQGYTKRSARHANLDTLYAHMLAKRSSPVPIYNCTLGGQLEVYERKDFFEALDNRERPVA